MNAVNELTYVYLYMLARLARARATSPRAHAFRRSLHSSQGRREVAPELIGQYREEGYVKLEGFWSSEELFVIVKLMITTLTVTPN